MSKKKLAVVAFILSSIIWGAGSPIFKWSIEGISPLLLAFFRFCVPVIVLLPFLGKLQRIRSKDLPLLILLGLCNCTLNIGLYFIGLQYSLSINQPIIASAGPLFIILGSALFLKDKASKKVLLGNLIGIAGVLFIVLEPVMGVHHTSSILGNALFILATVASAIGTLISKKLSAHYNAFTLVFWTFFIAALSLLPIPLQQFSQHNLLQQINFHSLVGILFGGIFSSLIAYALFYWGLHFIKASETTIFTYIDPIAAVLIAAPLLHEYPNPIFIIGTVLVFSGIYIAEGRIHWHPIHKLLQ